MPRSIALISSIIEMKAGSRCPISGWDIALRTDFETFEGPGPINNRVGGENESGTFTAKTFGIEFEISQVENQKTKIMIIVENFEESKNFESGILN